MSHGKKVLPKKLGEVLISRGLITQKQLDEALDIQKKDKRLLGEILVGLKYITEEAIAWALTVMYGYPYLPLENYSIDKNAVMIIPKEVAFKYHVLGLERIGSVLNVAMANPLNEDALRELEHTTQCQIRMFISTMTELQSTLNKCYGNGATEEGT